MAILTGGGDRPYALGLASALLEKGVSFDFIGSDDLEHPALLADRRVTFLNLRGDQQPDASAWRKILRVAKYYVRLVVYAVSAEPKIFHLLWNNKFELFDRTLLLLFYRMLGKKLAFTVHNVNIRKRDGNDGLANRVTLRLQYRLVDHLFVHTAKMKGELERDFGVPGAKVSVIPFGVNSTVPVTSLSGEDARRRLGLAACDRVILFFGNIAPYKGVEYLVDAVSLLARRGFACRLVIAGRPKGNEQYWESIEQGIVANGLDSVVTRRIEYVPDEETEAYFKAADALVLPYTHVFQSGVLFLGYNFGLPVIASDVGSLAEDVLEGTTGFVCAPADAPALAAAIERYFASELYRNREGMRHGIRRFALERYSWTTVGEVTKSVYETLAAMSRDSRSDDVARPGKPGGDRQSACSRVTTG